MVSATDHMTYIHEKVNPILEALVTAVLLERPDDPVNFMIKWLSEQSPEKLNTAQEVERLQVEIERLRAKQRDLQNVASAQTGSAEASDKPPGQAKGTTDDAPGAGAAGAPGAALESPASAATASPVDDEEEEEDEDDDVVDEIPPPSSYKKGQRASVSAEAYGEWNKKKEFVPVVHEKSEDQIEIINEKLSSSFMFMNLEPKDKQTVIDAIKVTEVAEGEKIIQEGDEGDCLYVIASGVVECYKNIEGEERLVKTCTVGDAFGELALLYNCPRAASVLCKEAATLLALDRETFNHIVKDSSIRKRELHDNFLKSVKILKNLDAFERGRIADALRVTHFEQGDYILRQGDQGDDFFIIEEGQCHATKLTDGEEQKVHEHVEGDYFGELALMKNEPRAANVIATTKVKCVALDRKTFNRLLGPIENVLQREY